MGAEPEIIGHWNQEAERPARGPANLLPRPVPVAWGRVASPMADPPRPGSPVRYVARIHPVREVTLVGAADHPFWKERLRAAGLHPAQVDGKAQVVVSAVGSRFRGIPFRELSISVLVSRREGGPDRDGVFLAGAFNSSRLFAFIERRFFRTPYRHGAVSVDPRPPASFEVAEAGRAILRGNMAAGGSEGARYAARTGEEGWEGPIFLPGAAPGAADGDRYFFGKVGGPTRAYPFDPSADAVALDPPPGDGAVRLLFESRFSGREWVLRETAAHARSGTLRGGAAAAFR